MLPNPLTTMAAATIGRSAIRGWLRALENGHKQFVDGGEANSSMSTQSPSVSAIQSRAQPSYALIEPGGKVLMRESPITIFAELTDKLAETCRHFWLFARRPRRRSPISRRIA